MVRTVAARVIGPWRESSRGYCVPRSLYTSARRSDKGRLTTQLRRGWGGGDSATLRARLTFRAKGWSVRAFLHDRTLRLPNITRACYPLGVFQREARAMMLLAITMPFGALLMALMVPLLLRLLGVPIP